MWVRCRISSPASSKGLPRLSVGCLVPTLRVPVEPFFMRLGGGRRFCVFHPASRRDAAGAFVYVHPFAEEMNKSRRMAALQSRALAAAGHAVLQIDLHGCGDSSGGFGDASWAAWIDDVVGACAWIIEKTRAPLWLWGLRA